MFDYFDHIICSEDLGFNKPSVRIFEHALSLNLAKSQECVMIGDSVEADVQGAVNSNIDCIFFNFNKTKCDLKVLKEVYLLESIKSIL